RALEPPMNRVEPPQPGTGLASSTVPPGPISWPPGVTAAACLTFDMDAEAAVLTADISSISRMSPMSHQSYGPLVGVPRILALLKRHGLTATFFIPGYSAHRYPDVVRAVAEAGHEIAHHSYFHENTIGMDEKTEAAMIDLGLRALHDVAGVRPEGYRAPMWEMNYHTPRLLAERGFRWDSSLMDSDHPYALAVDGLPDALVEVPVSWGLDDWEQYAFLPGLIGSGVIESPAKALEMWTLELDAMHRLGAAFVLCCHPFLSGRPSRAEALERLIERMKALDGLWITTVGEVARHTASLNLAPRTCPQPVIPADAYWVARPPTPEGTR
ncbi:MAG TPA: polysaccharide deacetylase, partial [Streptosporangiaceae bacterium]|nr:polysaccharide deacetylase [Streptosporangiaceae bacterium]